MLAFLIFIFASLVFVKSILFLVYLWQLKEYRFDRFLAEYGGKGKLWRFWLFSGGRKIWQPVWTVKAMVLAGISFLAVATAELLTPLNLSLIFSYLLIYLLIPIFVGFLVWLLKKPTGFLKGLAFEQARMRMEEMPDMIVIGITGSYGKSSTKEFLAQILSAKFKVAKTPANQNTEIGVAQYILDELPADAEIFIVEMAAYAIGEIKTICGIAIPKIGILTGISEQHLALFGSLENTMKAKYELIESLPEDGLAVFNAENQYCLELSEKWQGRKLTYKKSIVPKYKKLPEHYELNLNGAIAVARYLGMKPKEISEAIKGIELGSHMMQRFFGKKDCLIIDDTYSANPDGVLAALDYLDKLSRKYIYKIIVMPCLIELGGASSEVHERIGRKINDVCDLAIITTKDNFEDIKREAGGKAILAEAPEMIEVLLREHAGDQTAVLLEGRIPQAVLGFVKK